MGIFCTNPDVECMNGLPKSLAIEFDTWHSDHLTDPRMVSFRNILLQKTKFLWKYNLYFIQSLLSLPSLWSYASIAHFLSFCSEFNQGDLYIRENGTMFDSFRSNHIAVFSAGSKSNGNHHFLSVYDCQFLAVSVYFSLSSFFFFIF